ncbi:hypothetical protein ACHAW5_002106 [Stephanodiscus triporus]|uniref:CRC domain-containing protein n=1 Tax=Stephanodiscus triporus TaxID=2934178 RepID=A0ABD3MPM9_9STRA
MSHYRRDRLLSDALIHSPDPILDDANATDYDLLGREVMAAASTASAMLSRCDGFDPMPAFPGIGVNGSGTYDAGTMTATRYSGLDMSQFYMYPTQDAFPLPSILQAHLDETYAASTLILEQVRNAGREGTGGIYENNGQVFFQVTAYRPRNGGGDISAPGTTPPAVAFLSAPSLRCGGGTAIEVDSENVGGGKTTSHKTKKKTNITARPRPLPLRKRKLKVYSDSDDEEYKPLTEVVVAQLPVDNKRVLVRHNMRSDNDGERITCRCMKSQCLKLYCDCFQQELLCISQCACKSCKNTKANAGPGGVRHKAVEEVKKRRPDAFKPRTRDADEGCRCKKNKCLKKYCVRLNLLNSLKYPCSPVAFVKLTLQLGSSLSWQICFNQDIKCDSRCRCKNCGNQPTMDDMEEYDIPIKIKVRPPAKFKVSSEENFFEPVSSTVALSDESVFLEPPTPALPVEYTYGLTEEV